MGEPIELRRFSGTGLDEVSQWRTLVDLYPLSIVTGTRDRPDCFRRLLLSIVRHTQVPYELIVADASSVPYDVPLKPANIVWLPETPRLGMVKGYNRAFAAASGKWVIWLNDDCEVLPGYDTAAIDFMEANPKIGLGALYYIEKSLPKSTFHVNTFLDMLYANFGIIRRELGKELGWFDEDLTMYGSDNSLTFKCLLAGHGVTAITGSKVIHHGHMDDQRRENMRGQRVDAKHVMNKYMHRIDDMRAVYRQTRSVGGPLELSA